jgi:hypothetical protein
MLYKKDEGRIAEVMKGIIHDDDTVIEIYGRKYYLSLPDIVFSKNSWALMNMNYILLRQFSF